MCDYVPSVSTSRGGYSAPPYITGPLVQVPSLDTSLTHAYRRTTTYTHAQSYTVVPPYMLTYVQLHMGGHTHSYRV